MQRRPLKDLLELSDAGVWGEEDPNGGISVLRSTNFKPNGRLDFENLSFRLVDESKRSQKMLRDGDILLEKSGGGPKQPVGRVCLFRGHEQVHAFGNFLSRLRPRRELVEPEYLFYKLWHFHAQGLTASYQKQTSGIRNLETKRYLEQPILVPPAEEQRRIVALLSRAENIVRMRREAEAKAKEIIPALFLEMFASGSNAPGARHEGHRGTWPVVRLGDVLEAADYGTSTKADDAGAGMPMIRMSNVESTGRTDLTDLKFVKLSKADQAKYGLRAGDILFNRTNSKDLVGKTGLWRGECDAVAASYFIRVRTDTGKALPEYVWAFMNAADMKRVLFGMARGAIGQSNINAKELRSIEMPLPDLESQRSFGVLAEKCLALEMQQARATGQAEQAFQSLLASVFSQ